MKHMDMLKSKIIDYGRQLGFPLIRVTGAEPFQLWEREFTRRKVLDAATAQTVGKITSYPRDLMPGANAVIVAVRPYIPYLEFPKGFGVYSAHYGEYPQGREAIKVLTEMIVAEGYEALADPPLPAKAAAHRAGAGWFGKNGVIYTSEYGSWVTMHLILTDAPLARDAQAEELSHCEGCNRCVRACPTNAILENGRVLASRCLRAYMLYPGFVPLDIRDKMGSRLLGCDICQMVCPNNKKRLTQARLPSQDDMQNFEIFSLLNGWQEGSREKMKRIGSLVGRNYARARRFLSTAVIAAGNIKDPNYIPLLAKTLVHSYPPIRAHSAWALGQIGGFESRAILMQAFKTETDIRVIEEIRKAINISG
jgi:epoxyqueuosine reductase